MKYLSQGVKVGILSLVVVIGTYITWKTIGSTASGEANYEVWAKFKDASGLPPGSGVVVAGLPIGEIGGRAIEGRYARVTMRVREDVVIWSNAVVYKKASSLLGNYYVEIDPGSQYRLSATGERVENHILKPGDQIELVVEATTPDKLMSRIEQSMPNVDSVLLSVRDLSEDLRRVVNGPLASIADRVDELVAQETSTISRILERTDRTIAKIELIAGDIRGVTGTADDKINKILDQLDDATAEAREVMVTARKEVEETGAKVREKLDVVDDVFEHSASIAKKIDDDEGTLGRLVNDSTLADNLTDISDDAKGFVGTLFGMQTYVGLRSEYAFRGGGIRAYVNVEIYTRPDKFYLVELSKSPRGNYPVVSLEMDDATGNYRRNVLIEDKVRFTFQFGKRISWASFRYGIKESSGAIGMDAQWFDDRLKLSMDIFDAGFDEWPRLKLSAAFEVFKHLFILGGIDDALNPPRSLAIVDDGADVPVLFDELAYGRDYFLGAQLRFNDQDLSALLFIGGSALAGLSD